MTTVLDDLPVRELRHAQRRRLRHIKLPHDARNRWHGPRCLVCDSPVLPARKRQCSLCGATPLHSGACLNQHRRACQAREARR